MEILIWSHALPLANTPKVHAKGILPVRLIPAAAPYMSCSETPKPKNLSGNSFLNHPALVESVKSAADVNSPVSGTVIAVNEELEDNAEIVNQDPYGQGWLVEVELSNLRELDDLLDPMAYNKKVRED